MSYAATPTLSVEAAQVRVMPVSPMAPQAGLPGMVGRTLSAGAPTESRSRLGPPFAVVAVARIVLAPAARSALTASSAQVSQSPVPAKTRSALTAAPLTVIVIGRATVVPLAYRKESEYAPAAETVTENWTYDPVVLT